MQRRQEFIALFRESVGRPPVGGVSLSGLSSFRIGGTADLFFDARTEEELRKAADIASKESYPHYVIGGGSNILFDDEGFEGLLIRNRAEGLSFSDEGVSIAALSGTGLSTLVRAAAEKGLSGLEFLAGIPGTVGGAVYGNAGAFGRAVGDVIREVSVWKPGAGERRVSADGLGFGYRRSSLQLDRDIVLQGIFNVICRDRNAVLSSVREIMEKRKKRHPPWGTACAGSYFKNPCTPEGEKTAAGYLLEKAGARGLRIGDAAVYEGHCNFIVNLGAARSEDVLRLARQLRERVFERFGVRLEEEVVYLPAAASRP